MHYFGFEFYKCEAFSFFMRRRAHAMVSIILLVVGCAKAPVADYNPAQDSLRYEGEVHLRNIRQLTFGGNNAEAYWSSNDSLVVFQSDWSLINSQGCDQIYSMVPDGDLDYQMVSTGKGRTTCSYFLPSGRVLYASTHAAQEVCPAPPPQQDRYVWPIYDTYDIYEANPDGSDTKLLIGGPSYDAEATVSPDGRYIVFTSTRSGDLELWRLELDTQELLQLTSDLGYDGGAFFSPDARSIVWRASRPQGVDADEYKRLLANGVVEPGELNLFVSDIDGSNAHQVTNLPGANWAPFFHPDGTRIIFASNHESAPGGRPVFALYMIRVDGSRLQKLTHSGTFEAFPMFSFNGRRLLFSSNRNIDRTPSRDTNVFMADWVENPQPVDSQFVEVRR